MELVIVKLDKRLIDLIGSSVGRPLGINSSEFLLLLLLLLLPAGLQDLVQFLLPLRELLLDFVVTANRLLHPRMGGDLLNSRPLLRIVGNYPHKKILKGLTEKPHWSFAGMGLPENFVFFFLYQFVVGVVGGGLLEGRVSRQHDEEYDSSCKDVAAFALIFFGRNLRGHVAFGSELSLQNSGPVAPAKKAGKAKICDFQYEKMREQNVFRFYVSVREALAMHVVQSVHHLVEVSACHLL